MRKDMSPDEFAREMMNSFEAPVEGAYYTDALNSLQLQHRVARSPRPQHRRHHQLGSRHAPSVRGVAVPARRPRGALARLHRRHRQVSQPLHRPLALKAKAGGFRYRCHLLPHDVEVKELSTGFSRRHELVGLLAEPVITVPNHNTEDGIQATRGVLGVSWFDQDACRKGLARIRSYRRGKSGVAVPDESEDAADALRTGCVGIPMITSANFGRGRLRRRIRGLV